MGRINYLFTSESVTEGHPDKIADQISDGVLDAYIGQDPMSRVACETLVTTGLVMLAGEITSKAKGIDVHKIVRDTVKEIGYDDSSIGFDYRSCAILNALHEQSPDISMGVTKKTEEETGAGDQGLMFGYATNETPEYMPIPLLLAHKLTAQLAKVRKNGTLPWLRPDGKSQVTVEYVNKKAHRIEAVVISTQHADSVDNATIYKEVLDKVIKPILPPNLFDEKKCKIFINPTGRFVVGGPHGDSGLTGRKIIVDSYGGSACHGGGAFSGKDPTKVDRSASYMARYVAKNLVAAGIVDQCEVQLAYAIGIAEPVSVLVDGQGTRKVSHEKIVEVVRKNFDLRPGGIIKMLNLRKPIFQKTAAYGHFGRELPEFQWEKTDMADKLRKDAGL
ncbi:MAG: methionine adenosyltransferase [Nitrospinae bacterium]|nr:methionine adenosyltransferase [Nitrospinota bacterium]